jgi:DNA (cytosine-5)-methyltransferase 1
VTQLVLSLFPGIGLLDMAFEEAGFCVVRGPDLLWGGDVRSFHPPAGKFDGVIGGPPCQSHSPLVWLNRTQGVSPKHPDMTPEFSRVVAEAAPGWFLMENSPFVPTPDVSGFRVSRNILNNRWLGELQNRERVFCFGTRDGRRLHFETSCFEAIDVEPAVLASELTKGKPLGTRQRSPRKRSLAELAVLQGLPANFLAEAPFTVEGKCRVIGNGVPLPMGRAVAAAVKRALDPQAEGLAA